MTTRDPNRSSGIVPGYEFEGRRSQPAPDPWPQTRRGQAPPKPDGDHARRVRRTPTASPPARPWAWPNDDRPPGFEFSGGPLGPPPGQPIRPRRPSGAAGSARPGPRTAAAEWASLLRSFLPPPVKPSWSREFLAALQFRGWALRVAVPILTMVIFGVAVVVLADANSGNSGPAPPPAALGFPPATLAGNDFTAAGTGRGISQTLARVTGDGDEIVVVGSQAGARITRAQFFVSADDGRTWAMGSVRAAGGGPPPPGHAALFVAGGRGAWAAVGPGSIWTSPDGRTWTLAPGDGMPLLPGDRISAVKRTADGFIAVGANVPGGDQARSSPLILLSANGVGWTRLDAARLHLAAAPGRVVDITGGAVAGRLILITGDVVATGVTGKPVRAGAAWLSDDGGSAWTRAVAPGVAPAGPGAQPQIAGAAAEGGGFVLIRPATIAHRPAADVYFSPNGLAWTYRATLRAAAGFTAALVNGGPGGVVVAGRAGRMLTAFVSANGASWQQARPLGPAAAESLSGATLARGGTVVATGTASAGADSRRPVITLAGTAAVADHVDIAKIPGAVDPQLAVNGLAAQGSMQVAVGGANGFPAAWASTDGGSSWTRAVGAAPAVFGRAGTQQLTSVTHGITGWLAVGGVTLPSAASPPRPAEHPVVVVSADGHTWQAADGESAFAAPGLFTEQAAAGPGGYVIVGYQRTSPAGGKQRTIAAAWWSAGLAGWRRAGDAAAGALDGAGPGRQMLAVTAGPAGFVAVGWHGDRPSAWTSPDGRSWKQADLPLPAGTARAVLQQVASSGRTVVAVGAGYTRTGRPVPFAARSADRGATWTESALPAPAPLTSVTALAAAGGAFTATGTYGRTPGHQDVVVWTSPDGAAWKAATPGGQGLAGPGIQVITSLAASANTLTGVGFTASPAGEEPVFWQAPVR